MLRMILMKDFYLVYPLIQHILILTKEAYSNKK